MLKFPTQEWLEAYIKELNQSKEYEEAAKDWEGDFLFVIIPDGTGNLQEEVTLYMDLWHGKCREAYVLKPGETKETAFVFSGPYKNWQKVLRKELDPIQGLMQGKFKLKGDMAKVMRYVRAAQALVNAIMKVPTEFL
jgi:putative sterol carrier protein